MDTRRAHQRKAQLKITLLDGPLGTELNARGAETPLPAWSAHTVQDRPNLVRAIHRDYAAAGATVHTACTFRTRPETAGPSWRGLAVRAVDLCRSAVPAGHLVAGSLAPVHDCYRPELAPQDAYGQHLALAEVLADAGCDLLLVETHPSPREALQAVHAACQTGLPTWLALTAGPSADLMRPEDMGEIAQRAIDLGVDAVLVNCVAATATLPYVVALVEVAQGVPVGAYGNAGHVDDQVGWRPGPPGPDRYVQLARQWVKAGASVLGACCGTTPAHIEALRTAIDRGTMQP
jgi:S-methylmethionine-dependent homocysteine/selenocysteine methylase